MLRWFWRRRRHGYRHGYCREFDRPDRQAYRWGGDCARCGGFEYDGTIHPRGMWALAEWWEVR